MADLSTARWLRRFRVNAARPRQQLFGPLGLPPEMHAAVVRSIQRFQLGETGEGTIVHQARAREDDLFDEATKQTVALWVREEGRHAAELADVLRALGAEPLRRHASQSLFKAARRLFGLRTKLLAIGVAEIVGIVFYRLLRDEVPSEPLAGLAAALVADEEMHLEFLGDLFARAIAVAPSSRWERARIEIGTSVILAGAVTTMLLDQRAFFAAVGVSGVELWRRCFAERATMLRRSGRGPDSDAAFIGEVVAAASP